MSLYFCTNVPVSKGHVAPSNSRNGHVPMSILRVEGNRDVGITESHMDSVTVNLMKHGGPHKKVTDTSVKLNQFYLPTGMSSL